jgi:putative chitinase
MVTVERLIAAGLSPTAAKTFAVPLQAACERYNIQTPNRLGGLVGQLMIESQGFTRLEENLFYTTPARIAAVWPSRFKSAAEAAPFARNPQRLANRVYAGKIGNGDEASGDGWRYRGRGLKQLTGRGNYDEARVRIGVDYVARPEIVAEPVHAALTAAWFFARHSCNPLADEGQWDAITRKVNGPAMLQASQRRAATLKAVRAFR